MPRAADPDFFGVSRTQMPNRNTTTAYHDSAIEDLLGRPPGWLLHSGLTVLAGVALVLLALTALIRYPEEVDAGFVLQTEVVPLALHAGVGRVVEAVPVGSGAPVVRGDTLLIFRSGADWRQVRCLGEWARRLRAFVTRETTDAAPRYLSWLADAERLPAGPFTPAIQQGLTEVKTVLRAWQSYERTHGSRETIATYQEEIADARRLSQSLQTQVALFREELGYQEKQDERNGQLAREGIVSRQEAEMTAARTVNARRQLERLVSSDIQNQLRVRQLEQQIVQVGLQYRQSSAEFSRRLRAALATLETALVTFREEYVLLAEEDGELDWQPGVRPQATVTSSDPLGFILPPVAAAELVARLELPMDGLGEIRTGDPVILEFTAFSSREYGQVRGRVAALAPIAVPNRDRDYVRQATVALPTPLRTTYGKVIPFNQNLTGRARIITTERSLLARLFDRFLNLTKNN